MGTTPQRRQITCTNTGHDAETAIQASQAFQVAFSTAVVVVLKAETSSEVGLVYLLPRLLRTVSAITSAGAVQITSVQEIANGGS